jgi:hypothetical protein
VIQKENEKRKHDCDVCTSYLLSDVWASCQHSPHKGCKKHEALKDLEKTHNSKGSHQEQAFDIERSKKRASLAYPRSTIRCNASFEYQMRGRSKVYR